MDDEITYETKMGDGSDADASFLRKIFSAGKRFVAGESLFMTHFTNIGSGKKDMVFAELYPVIWELNIHSIIQSRCFFLN